MKANTPNNVMFMYSDAIAQEIYVPAAPLHRHDNFEIAYVLKGTSTNVINGEAFPLDATACHIVRPSDVHRFMNAPSRPNPEHYKHIDIYVSTEKFQKICNSISPTFYNEIIRSENPIVFHISDSLKQTVTSKINALIFQTAEPDVLNIFLHFTVSTLLSAYFEETHYKRISNYPQWLNELMQKLQSIDFLSLSISELATHFNYSASHLSREFKKHVGVKLIDYIQNERIKYSLILLQEQKLKIIEIAGILGYEKQSTFSSLFKKVMNCSPKEYQLKSNAKQKTKQ